jgi:RNA binding motif
VDYTRNLPEGYLRFEKADEAARCVHTITEGKLMLGTTTPQADLLSGDEEKAYWEAALKAHTSARQARELLGTSSNRYALAVSLCVC